MGQDHIQTRVPSKLYQQIEEYEEEGAYMNQAEAIRHLLRAGLDAEAEEEPGEVEEAVEDATGEAQGNSLVGVGVVEAVASPKTVLLGAIILATSALIMATPLAYPSIVVPALVVSTALAVLATVTIWLAAVAQLALARPLRALVGFSAEVRYE
jgi:Arc/MetJ-type ribon-helix-helix transcriptional regulator